MDGKHKQPVRAGCLVSGVGWERDHSGRSRCVRFQPSCSARSKLSVPVDFHSTKHAASFAIAGLANTPIIARPINTRAGQYPEFDPNADSYIWDRFLDDVFDHREPLVKFVQRAFGYSITGDVREHILLIFYGKGANGKSSAVDAVMNAIGPDYSMQSPPGLLVERRGESHPTELASLFGKRLVIASETEQTADLAEGLIKQLTGGDAISARRMREDFWTFQPSHKIILATNHRPKVKGTDHGIWRRLRLVPFTQTFEGQRKDASLKGRLLSIPAGILAWLVRGCLEWQREGLGSADEVDAATAGYKSEQDVIGRFVSDCCMQSAAYRIRFSALYAALEKWVGEIGDNLPTKKMFGEWLGANGFESKRSNGAWWIGTTTRPELDENSNVTFEHFQ